MKNVFPTLLPKMNIVTQNWTSIWTAILFSQLRNCKLWTLTASPFSISSSSMSFSNRSPTSGKAHPQKEIQKRRVINLVLATQLFLDNLRDERANPTCQTHSQERGPFADRNATLTYFSFNSSLSCSLRLNLAQAPRQNPVTHSTGNNSLN